MDEKSFLKKLKKRKVTSICVFKKFRRMYV